jgi:hypothetical protein
VLSRTRRFHYRAARIYLLFFAADSLIRGLLFTFLAVYFVTRVGMNPLQW